MEYVPTSEWIEARPDFDDLSPKEQLEHIESCPLCSFCENDRVWGFCTWCGDLKEALPPEGLSRCCGSPVRLTGEDD